MLTFLGLLILLLLRLPGLFLILGFLGPLGPRFCGLPRLAGFLRGGAHILLIHFGTLNTLPHIGWKFKGQFDGFPDEFRVQLADVAHGFDFEFDLVIRVWSEK